MTFFPSRSRVASHKPLCYAVVVVGVFARVITPVTAQSANEVWVPSLNTLSGFRDRPLFSPSRKPTPVSVIPIAVDVVAAEPEEFSAILIGIISDQKGNGFALVQDRQSGEHVKVVTGALYHGWTLIVLTRHSAIFERDGRRVDLTFVARMDMPDESTPGEPDIPGNN